MRSTIGKHGGHVIDVDGHLTALGLLRPAEPNIGALRALHRAQVERVAYENLDIHLGRPTGIGAEESAARIARGRGGYCFHLNGAFAALLTALGFDVTLHRAGVQGNPGSPAGATGNHLALTVRIDGERWLVDTGLGDGLYEPLPLREGSYAQGPFTYGLAPSDAEPGGWRLLHDPRGSFTAMDFAPEPVELSSFAGEHVRLSTSPESDFVRVLTAQRRDAKGVDVLRGRVLRRIDAGGTADRTLDAPEEWYEVLTGLFRLDLGDVDAAARAALWDRVGTAHRAWEAGRSR
ncbi:arylamine N-acetyltransferase [Streptomyces filamentosus]|uniref:Arylamine N-acetyltransferase n=1 Tax=Streptomyces filamentosus TaxID=67294 RepID=A0A919BVN4_STRFL|nr:arylamine N-acetyltransferase [Streptomyces filamentosus]KAA6217379.1 arylamine N-acetyltransferase [Streptomyces filamentosus]GHG15967.1 arylamine N-acetyltransferase [Streptomyces filamentosus]